MKKFGFKSSDVKGGCIVSLDRNLKTVKYILNMLRFKVNSKYSSQK